MMAEVGLHLMTTSHGLPDAAPSTSSNPASFGHAPDPGTCPSERMSCAGARGGKQCSKGAERSGGLAELSEEAQRQRRVTAVRHAFRKVGHVHKHI